MPAPPAPPTFLDDLSDAAWHNVLRHLSSRPFLSFWSLYVEPEDALSAMDPSSSLCTIARGSFTSVWAVSDDYYPPGDVPQLVR